jgi:hypothetical protein
MNLAKAYTYLQKEERHQYLVCFTTQTATPTLVYTPNLPVSFKI